MKKILTLALSLVMAVVFLTACSNNQSSSSGGDSAKPLNLEGTWKQSNATSPDNYQKATIENGAIEIYWVAAKGETESLYWSGTYEAPTEATTSYLWVSQNDTAKTKDALLASNDATKTFTYKDGKLSYEATALGKTTTIELERQ